MPKLYPCFFLFILVITCSCKEQRKKQTETEIRLVEYESVKEFHIPDSIYPVYNDIINFQDSIDEYLFVYGSDDYVLRYSASDCSVQRIISVDKRGDRGMGRTYGMLPLNKSDILIFSELRKRFFLTDMEKEKFEVFNYSVGNPAYFRDGCNAISLNDSMLIFPIAMSGNWSSYTSDDLKNHKTLLRYNLSSKKAEAVGMGMPFYDQGNTNRDYRFSVTNNNNQVVMSFSSDHRIFYSNDLINFKEKEVHSKYLKKKLGIVKHHDDVENIFRSYIENDIYKWIVWDKYRKVYYRMFKVGHKHISPEDDMRQLHSYPIHLGVMILDEDFNILGEQLLTPRAYNASSYFVNAEGLWLGISPNSEDYDPDYAKFRLLTVEDYDGGKKFKN